MIARFTWLTYPAVILHIVFYVQVFVFVHYFMLNPFLSLSYLGDDGLGLHCGNGMTARSIGYHCFGDYSEIRNYFAGVSETGPWFGYPGLGNTFHFLGVWVEVTTGEYYAGLFAYLSLLGIAVLTPWLYFITRSRFGIGEKILSVFAIGPLSLPVIVAMDRANSVGFVVPFLLLFVLSIYKRNYLWAAVAVVAAASIKPQFLLLLLAFFVVKKLTLALWSVVAFVAVNFMPYVFDQADFPDNLSWSFEATFGFPGSRVDVGAYPKNLSLVAPLTAIASGVGLSGLFFVALIGGLVSLTLFVVRTYPHNFSIAHFLTIVLLTSGLLVPFSGSYYLLVVLPIWVTWIFFLDTKVVEGRKVSVYPRVENLMGIVGVVGVAFSLGFVVIPLAQIASGVYASTLSIVPSIWLAYLALAAVHAVMVFVAERRFVVRGENRRKDSISLPE